MKFAIEVLVSDEYAENELVGADYLEKFRLLTNYISIVDWSMVLSVWCNSWTDRLIVHFESDIPML